MLSCSVNNNQTQKNMNQKNMNQKIVSSPKKYNEKLNALIAIWKDNVKLNNEDMRKDEKANLKVDRIDAIPKNKDIESIFYAYHGFESRNDVRSQLNSAEKKIWLKPTFRNCIFNKELFTEAVRKVYSHLDPDSLEMMSKIDFIEDFLLSAEKLMEMIDFGEDDWELLPLENAICIFDNDTRVIIDNSPTKSLSLSKNLSVKNSGLKKVTIENMKFYYDNSLEKTKESDLFTVRVYGNTNVDLLVALIGNTVVFGAKWIVDFPHEMSKRKKFEKAFFDIQNISDAIVKIN